VFWGFQFPVGSLTRTTAVAEMYLSCKRLRSLLVLILRTEAVDPFESLETTQFINRLLCKLKVTDREIVELFYGLVGDGLSTKEIAAHIGKTPAEVNRSLKVARAQMRKEVVCKR
jgi:DNA-directed RNA polymerase specialized sigma subunit